MRLLLMAMFVVSISLTAVTQEQDEIPAPKLSTEPLTSEQIAIYRAVLKNYLKGSDGKLNLANTTEPFDKSISTCLEGIEENAIKKASLVVHRIEPLLVQNTNIVLVDPDKQQTTIEKNDPQNLIKRSIDDHEKVTDDQLDQSVKQAFDTGLFRLSEIVFDKTYHHAVVSYSFVCGGLCGNGTRLILTKFAGGWKVTKRCGGWVS